jgi:hypothetical protein
MSYQSAIQNVTPEKAKKWLENQHRHQRPIRMSVVDRYAKMMAAGEWITTAQGITFDTDGKLIDGAHRLNAVIAYGNPVFMRITNGEDPKSFLVYDCGVGRTASDRTILDPNDRNRNKRIVTLVRSYVCYAKNKNGGFTSADVLTDTYNEFKRGFDAVADAGTKGIVRKNSGVMAAVAIYASLHPGKASSFLLRLSGDAPMRGHDPAGGLLRYLSQRSYRSGMDDYWYAVNMCRADLNGTDCHKVTKAVEDMAGNKLMREVWARSNRGRKS